MRIMNMPFFNNKNNINNKRKNTAEDFTRNKCLCVVKRQIVG